LYQVLEEDLMNLESLIAAEQRAFGHLTFCVGALLSVLLAWATSTTPGTLQQALFWSGTLTFSILGVYFGSTWLDARKRRPRLVERLRRSEVAGE
jgi:hypothetical protein